MVNEIWLGNCSDLIDNAINQMIYYGLLPVIVSDPPFNIGYKYRTYKDKIPENEYLKWLVQLTSACASVIILYPEILHKLTLAKQEAPKKIATWVYNSNTNRQHRDIAFYGITPDFRKEKQPYKNPNDKRIKKLIAQGKGARLYDWWNINQVKNTSNEKTTHPCQMPIKVMENIIGILPDNVGIIDPFCGSGTTGIACKIKNKPFIGIELDLEYYKIAKERIEKW